MKFWIGVVGSQEGVDRMRGDAETWWCAPDAASAGDKLAVYFAKSRVRSLTPNEMGVVGIFMLVGAEPAHDDDCRRHSTGAILRSFKARIVERYPVCLTLSEMRRDALLSSATFVRRGMQGTTFSVTPAQFGRIVQLLNGKRDTQSRHLSG